MTDFIRISAPNVLQIRLLPDGGLLAAAHTAILRYDSAGHLTRSYDLGGPDYWRSLAIAEDGKSFWAASRRSVVHFDLNDATVSEQFMPADEFTDGIALRHEFRAAASTAGRPASPVDLVATLTPEAKIALSWIDRADNESGFELEYQVREEPFRSLGTVGPDVRLVIVTVPNSVLAYRFRVRAFNARGVSGYSNLATVPDPTAEP